MSISDERRLYLHSIQERVVTTKSILKKRPEDMVPHVESSVRSSDRSRLGIIGERGQRGRTTIRPLGCHRAVDGYGLYRRFMDTMQISRRNFASVNWK